MGSNMIQLYARRQAGTALHAHSLSIFRPRSRLTATCTRLTTQRLRQRSLHTTPTHHRRPPPPIRVAKPKTTPPKEPARQQQQQQQQQQKQKQQQTHQHQPPQPPQSSSRSRFRLPRPKLTSFTAIALLGLLVFFTPSFSLTPKDKTKKPKHKHAGKPLNQTNFTPFTITAREQVSPTAFVLTVEPAAGGRATPDVIRAAWAHRGTWAVEVKQPELMVARDYTPLPDVSGFSSADPLAGAGAGARGGGDGARAEAGAAAGAEAGAEAEAGKLRLYIRRMDGGEVSNYLARLRVGDEVELRGPKLGFDLLSRVGSAAEGSSAGEDTPGRRTKVVFLAGGTGIAPALQAARALLDRPGVEMEVVWANRRREDCLGCGSDGSDGSDGKGPVVAMLEDFRRAYGGRFKYTCTVDEEGSFISADTIARLAAESSAATTSPTASRSIWGLWSAGGTTNPRSEPVAPPHAATDSSACSYHSPRALVTSDDRDAPRDTGPLPCRCKDADGNPVRGGKNLLMLSGPEGFIAHFAGAKVWADGKELQGPVRGVISDLLRKNPGLRDDWLVLKL